MKDNWFWVFFGLIAVGIIAGGVWSFTRMRACEAQGGQWLQSRGSTGICLKVGTTIVVAP